MHLTRILSASNRLTLRSAPPRASNLPSGLTSKLVTGFFATVRVLIRFQLLVSHVVINAFLSIERLAFRDAPAVVCEVAFTIVKSREAVLPRPKRAARNVHFKDLDRTGDCMTCDGSGGSDAESFSLSAEGVSHMCMRWDEQPRNSEPSSLKSVSNISSSSKLRSGMLRSSEGYDLRESCK